MPEFPGGERGLISYIQENISYPEEAREAGVQGMVMVEFVVRDDGSITNVKAIRSPGESLSKAAVEIIENMPKWIPGQQNGENINVYFTVPLNFTLQ